MKIRFFALAAAVLVSGMATAQIGSGATVDQNRNTGIGSGATTNQGGMFSPDNSGVNTGVTVGNNGIGSGVTVGNNGIGNGATVSDNGIGSGVTVNGDRNTGGGMHIGASTDNRRTGHFGGHRSRSNNDGYSIGNGARPRYPQPRPGVYDPDNVEADMLKSGHMRTNRATVFFDLYSYDNISYSYQPWVVALHNKIVNGLHDTHRINVVDVSGQNGLDIYDSSRDRDGNILRERRNWMRQKGGTYALEVQIVGMNCYAEPNHRDPSRPTWTAEVNYRMRLVDLATGQLLDQKSYDPSSDYATMGDQKNAIDLMNMYVAERAKYITLNDFHISGSVMQIIDLQRDEAKKVAINVGVNDGVVRGTKFNVYQASIIGGQMVKEKIGQIKVDEVRGPNLAYAKVKKGGDAIYDFYHAQRPDRLYIETGEPGFFEYK